MTTSLDGKPVTDPYIISGRCDRDIGHGTRTWVVSCKALLPEWIDDYCEVHPHSGLKYRSPREFLRLSA